MSSIDLKKIEWNILSNDDDCENFVCGEPPIDDFIHDEAIDYQTERLGVSYVFRYENSIVGFVTLSMADLKKDKLKGDDKLKYGKENYPALQISQLAVCKELGDNNIGTFLCDFCSSCRFYAI